MIKTPPLGLDMRYALLPLTWIEMWAATAETLRYRLPMLAMAGPLQDDQTQRESLRMVTEKLDASVETGKIAAKAVAWHELVPVMTAWTQFPTNPFAAMNAYCTAMQEVSNYQQTLFNWPLNTAARLVDASHDGVEPWRRRVRENAKRLRRDHEEGESLELSPEETAAD